MIKYSQFIAIYMNCRLAAPLCSGLLATLAVPVQAAEIHHVYDGLSTNQYLQIMIATLVMVAVFIGILYFIGKRHSYRKSMNPVTKYLFMFLSIITLVFGTLLLVLVSIVLIEPYVATNVFGYVVTVFQYYFPEFVLGIIIFGATGLLLYLVGFYTMIFVLESTRMVKETEKYRIQASSEVDLDVVKGNVEYSGLAYRVTSWDTGKPLSDGKIRLETKDGSLTMIKYTDSEGEVNFGKLRGREEDYYAYVEGDRERQEYRFITLS
jgi:hypothetical protein